MTQLNICLGRRGFQSSLAHHCSEFFLEIRHQFRTSILLLNWILTNQQTPLWNLRSDAYFEYTSCYFKVATFFARNLFRVRLPYLLLILSKHLTILKIIYDKCVDIPTKRTKLRYICCGSYHSHSLIPLGGVGTCFYLLSLLIVVSMHFPTTLCCKYKPISWITPYQTG
jgi:hypothetical protein